MMRRLLLIIALLTSCAMMRAAVPTDTVVSLVNVYPGHDIYELEGHTALRLTMPGGDYAVSWGTFDFDSPNFVYRFVKGETDYRVDVIPWQPFERYYAGCGRRIVSHRIDFTPEQTRRLLDLIADNLLPQNRVYRYNYVLDNCATRPLRMLELAAGDSLVVVDYGTATDSIARPLTFRNVMRRYHRNYPWYQFGIDLALGSGIDRPVDSRELTFAPVLLDAAAGRITLRGSGRRLTAGAPVAVADFAPAAAVAAPTPWYLTPMAAALAVLALAAVLTVRDVRRRRVTRWFDAVLYGLQGLAGCLLTFLIFVSVHEATSPNLLLMWLNPLALVVPVLIWLKKCKVAVFSYQIINFALLFAMCAVWPFADQSANAAFWPLIAADALRSLSYIYIYVTQKSR